MDWLTSLFPATPSTQSSLLLLALVIVLGLALGNIRYKGIKLGVAGVLFVGLAFGHFGFHMEPTVLEFVREFGLILFVYAIGMSVGPGFFNALRAKGWRLNLLASTIVGSGVVLTVLLCWLLDVARPISAGIFSGATTNTPSLASAGQALRERPPTLDQSFDALSQVSAERSGELAKRIASGETDQAELYSEVVKLPSLGYAATYPFGVLGAIAAMILLRLMYRVDSASEAESIERQQREAKPLIEKVHFRITNPNLVGCKIAEVPAIATLELVVSRIGRGDEVHVAQGNFRLALGDVLLVVGRAEALRNFGMIVGERCEVDLTKVPSQIAYRWVTVTKRDVVGQTLAVLRLPERYDVQVTRLQRADVELPPRGDTRVGLLDRMLVVGPTASIEAVAKEVGDKPKSLETPELIPAFIGIALGIVLGSCPIWLPGIPSALRLGLAGGPLVVAILLSRFQRIGSLLWYMPNSANLLLRDLGIALFLVCVGLKGGDRLVETLLTGEGLKWMAIGVIVTLAPLLGVGAIARSWLKMTHTETVGLLAGAMTDPPALAFAQGESRSQLSSLSYASVYPLAMILRILATQLLLLVG